MQNSRPSDVIESAASDACWPIPEIGARGRSRVAEMARISGARSKRPVALVEARCPLPKVGRRTRVRLSISEDEVSSPICAEMIPVESLQLPR